MKVKYLFNGKIQVGKGDRFFLGHFSPQKESGDLGCYAHMLCLGLYFICWGD